MKITHRNLAMDCVIEPLCVVIAECQFEFFNVVTIAALSNNFCDGVGRKKIYLNIRTVICIFWTPTTNTGKQNENV